MSLYSKVGSIGRCLSIDLANHIKMLIFQFFSDLPAFEMFYGILNTFAELEIKAKDQV